MPLLKCFSECLSVGFRCDSDYCLRSKRREVGSGLILKDEGPWEKRKEAVRTTC